MVKYVFSGIIFVICFLEVRSDIKGKFESFCQANEPVEIDDSKEGCGNFTHNKSSQPKSWIIHLNKEEEDGINIKVSSFDLKNSFLVLREASRASSGKIQFISGESQESINFFIPYSKSFYMEICPEENTDESGAFTIAYEREVPDFGEGPLPTEPPEVEKERQSVEIQFKGKTPKQFRDELLIMRFKEAVKSIAHDFCLKNNIKFENSKPADEMITIHNIHKCPIEWSDTEICTSIDHSVFVSGGDDINRYIWEYQLTRVKLQKMWKSADNKYLQPIGLSIYKIEDKGLTAGWWILIVVIPCLFVVGCVYLLRATYKYIVEDFQNNSSVTVETADVEKRKKSKLKPNKYQGVPVFLKEEKIKEDDRKIYANHASYRAALLLTSYKLKESIPE